MNIWRQRHTCVVILRIVKGSIHENMLGVGVRGREMMAGTKTKDEVKRWCSRSVKGRTQNFEGKCEQ